MEQFFENAKTVKRAIEFTQRFERWEYALSCKLAQYCMCMESQFDFHSVDNFIVIFFMVVVN